jgi:lipopolysaccharide transport system permease protein
VFFPREVPVLSAVVSASIDFGIGLALFAVIGPFLGATVSAWWLLAPILSIALAVLAAAVSTPLAALNVYYRDFRFALPFALQLWLFASPVAYPLSVVPEVADPHVVIPAAGLPIVQSGLAVARRGLGLWHHLTSTAIVGLSVTCLQEARARVRGRDLRW